MSSLTTVKYQNFQAAILLHYLRRYLNFSRLNSADFIINAANLYPLSNLFVGLVTQTGCSYKHMLQSGIVNYVFLSVILNFDNFSILYVASVEFSFFLKLLNYSVPGDDFKLFFD